MQANIQIVRKIIMRLPWHVCSSETFHQIDHAIFQCLWRWAKRRHPHRSREWVAGKYFGTLENRKWRFFGETRLAKGEPMTRNWLKLAAQTHIVRHIKVRTEANPYDPADATYFANRKVMQKHRRIARPIADYDRRDEEEFVQFLNEQQSPKPRLFT